MESNYVNSGFKFPSAGAKILAVLMLLDIVTTLIGISKGVPEGNPLASVVGVEGLIILKLVMIGVILGYAKKSETRSTSDQIKYVALMVGLSVLHVFAVFWNVAVTLVETQG